MSKPDKLPKDDPSIEYQPNSAMPFRRCGLRTVLTITCGVCGAADRFEGDFHHAIAEFQASGRWFHDRQGFTVCHNCGRKPASERLERTSGRTPRKMGPNP